MVENCIFCQIVAGNVPARIVYHDDDITAFEDRHPAAPVHLLIIPNRHIASLSDATGEDAEILGRLLLAARRLALEQNLQRGYRVLINTGPDSGQTVLHLHLHLLGGSRLPRFTR